MNEFLLIYILLGVIALSICILLLVIKATNKSEKVRIQKRSYKSEHSLYIRSYNFLIKYPLAKKYLNRIKSRVEMLDLSDQWTIIKKTMKIAYGVIGLSTVLTLLIILLNHKLYYVIIGLLSIYIIHNQFLKIFVDRLDDKLLIHLEKLLGDVRHNYHIHGMIDEAIYDSLDSCSHEIAGHVMRMHEILSSQDTEENLSKYYDAVPNKFFKTFLALSYTVQKFGDKIVDGKSMFLTNLNYIKQEINFEILKRKRLSYLFQSLGFISVMPVFCLSAIENWAKNNMQELEYYYKGSYGFIVQISLFFVVIISFELINKMQRRQGLEIITDTLEKKLIKLKPVRHILRRIINNQYNKTIEIQELIKKTGQKITVEGFYIKRFLWALLGFAISITVIIYAYQIEKHNILYKAKEIEPTYHSYELELDFTALQREYILHFYDKNPSYQTIEQALYKDQKVNKSLVPIYTKIILEKSLKYETLYFKWWQLLICMLIGFTFYYLPYWFLLFHRQIMHLSLEDEVMQFHTIILMLMHIDRISVEDILEWMSVFATIFKESIEKCLNNFEQGDIKALEELKEEEPFLPFSRLVENLQAACDRITIQKAFDELKIERAYYQDKRKQDNEMIINKKATWGKLIAFAPLSLTVIFYIITPFIHLSITQFINYTYQIKSYL